MKGVRETGESFRGGKGGKGGKRQRTRKEKGRGEGDEDEEELGKMEEMIMQKYIFKYSQYTLFSSEKYQSKITTFKCNTKDRY